MWLNTCVSILYFLVGNRLATDIWTSHENCTLRLVLGGNQEERRVVGSWGASQVWVGFGGGWLNGVGSDGVGWNEMG